MNGHCWDRRPYHSEDISTTPQRDTIRIDKRISDVYTAVGELLQRFTTGPLPKAFKSIPSLTHWEEILYLTNPEKWTPHAVFQATRLFTSNLNPAMSQRFCTLILLPKIRNDINENKKLHLILFQSLKKALYKPATFYKGIIIPLCKSRTCTLREAAILSCVLRKASIPAVHSTAALLSLAKLEYHRSTSYFIRVLLEKGYPLPVQIVDGLVDHFVSSLDKPYDFHVAWYQALLAFVRRYSSGICAQDRSALYTLTRAKPHKQLSLEIQSILRQTAKRKQLHSL